MRLLQAETGGKCRQFVHGLTVLRLDAAFTAAPRGYPARQWHPADASRSSILSSRLPNDRRHPAAAK
jgi:hypothetical protein